MLHHCSLLCRASSRIFSSVPALLSGNHFYQSLHWLLPLKSHHQHPAHETYKCERRCHSYGTRTLYQRQCRVRGNSVSECATYSAPITFSSRQDARRSTTSSTSRSARGVLLIVVSTKCKLCTCSKKAGVQNCTGTVNAPINTAQLRLRR